MLRSLPRDLTVQRTNRSGSKMCSNGGRKISEAEYMEDGTGGQNDGKAD